MKKILLLMLTLFLVIGLIGCSANEQNEGEDINTTLLKRKMLKNLLSRRRV